MLVQWHLSETFRSVRLARFSLIDSQRKLRGREKWIDGGTGRGARGSWEKDGEERMWGGGGERREREEGGRDSEDGKERDDKIERKRTKGKRERGGG